MYVYDYILTNDYQTYVRRMDICSSFRVCAMKKCSFCLVSKVFSAFLSLVFVCELLIKRSQAAITQTRGVPALFNVRSQICFKGSYAAITQTCGVPAFKMKTFLAVTFKILGRDYTNSCFTSLMCYYVTIVVNQWFLPFVGIRKGTDGERPLGMSITLS